MDILKQLCDYAEARVTEKKKQIPLEAIKAMADSDDLPARPSFLEAMKQPGMSFICECKKASSSRGMIDPVFDYRKIAVDYEAAGADAISCLTEPELFLGADTYLKEIAEIVNLPVLRKDFVVDPYMIYEAKVLGASAVLLIVSALSEAQLKEYLAVCEEIGLDALTETHSEAEAELALRCGAKILGVNNRNLRNFEVDVTTSRRIRSLLSDDAVMIAESGLKTREDIRLLEEAGIDGVLIGETMMKASDKREMLRILKGEQQNDSRSN